jgi:hypothetical protein
VICRPRRGSHAGRRLDQVGVVDLDELDLLPGDVVAEPRGGLHHADQGLDVTAGARELVGGPRAP